jgi:hypothetical protein
MANLVARLSLNLSTDAPVDDITAVLIEMNAHMIEQSSDKYYNRHLLECAEEFHNRYLLDSFLQYVEKHIHNDEFLCAALKLLRNYFQQLSFDYDDAAIFSVARVMEQIFDANRNREVTFEVLEFMFDFRCYSSEHRAKFLLNVLSRFHEDSKIINEALYLIADFQEIYCIDKDELFPLLSSLLRYNNLEFTVTYFECADMMNVC